jgi:putative MATE family efflux protein
MLGHLNADFFSAIGNAGAPYHMVVSAITAVCGGTAILVAQGIGAGDTDRVRKIAGASFLGSGILSGGVFVLFFCCAEGLFQLMGVRSPILEYCTGYIRILSLSLLFLGPSATATAVLQGVGLTRIIMAAGIAGNLLNILLDWLLIFGKLGFPALGIRGAALATVLANAVSAGLTVTYVLFHPGMPFRLKLRRSPAGALRSYRQVLRLGIPSGLEYALWNVGNLILISFLNRLDSMAAGIYTLVFSIETVPLLIYMGFANAGLTLVGQQTGANDPLQARKTGLICLACSLAVCAAVAAVFHAFPRQLLGLFTDDPTVVEVSVPYLKFVSWILFPKAVNNVIGLCIRGLGDTRWMLLTQIFGTCFMVLGGYYLILVSGLGLSGIFLTLLLDEALRGTANLIRFLCCRAVLPRCL